MASKNKTANVPLVEGTWSVGRSCKRCSEPFKVSREMKELIDARINTKVPFFCPKCGNRQVERW